jgi:hypothetical protein
MKVKTSESSSGNRLWDVMNDLEMVTSKIVSAREIIDSAAEAIQKQDYNKAETLAMAAYEFLGYYLDEHDSKFQLAWQETILKQRSECKHYTDEELSAMCDAAEGTTFSEQKSWTVPIEVDGPNGEWYITFPDELIEKVGWEEGDTLEWVDNKDGTFSIKKSQN